MTRSTKLCSSSTALPAASQRMGLRLIRSSLLGLILLLAGCTTSPMAFNQASDWLSRRTTPSRPLSASPKQLKLGMLLSISGGLAKFGNPMQDTTRLLIETVNSCNGVVGQAVQIFSEDDQSSASVGKAGMTRLAEEDGVGVVIGAIGSEVSNATVDIAVKEQIVQISPASASPVLTERAKKGALKGFWFRTMPPDNLQGDALAQLAKQRGFKTVSILMSDNDYGNGIAQSFETTFKKLGGKIDGRPVRYSPYAGLYGVDIFSAFTGQPDAVLVIADPSIGSDILKIAYDSGLWSGSTKVLLTASMKTDNLARQVGQSINSRYIASGVLGVAPSPGDEAAKTEFRELYKNRFDREPSLYDPNTWDAAAVVVLAAEAAGETTGAAIKTEISKVANSPGIEVSDVCQALSLVREGKDINYQGASGTVDFNKSGDVIGNYDVWTVDYTGKIEVESKVQAGKD